MLLSLSLALSLVWLPLQDARTSTADWPSWRGPARDGTSSETAWVDEAAEQPLWSADVGLGYSCFAVADGRLYTKGFDEERKVDVTWCMNATTGEVVWKHEHPSHKGDTMHKGGTLTTPVAADGVIYTLSRLGGLYALGAKKGEVIWSRELPRELEIETGTFGFSSSPVVIGGQVFVNVGKTAAFDAKTGEPAWQTPDYGYSYGTPAPFTRAGTDYLAIFNAKGLVVLKRSDGSEVALHPWTSEYNVNCATPIDLGDSLFISTGYNEMGCARLALEDGGLEVVWESKVMSTKMNGCILFDGHLYGFDKKLLKCVDLDGKEMWRERGLGTGALTIAGGRLIVLSEEGELLVARATPEGFEARSRNQVLEEGVCWTTPVLAGGLVYCRNGAGKLVCLDHRTPR